jgi:uncharacterized membrane protein YeaQ/YmgE (transglycosylase-associated protein family)
MKKIKNPWRNHPEYNCFGCCPDNPIGLHLEFYEDGDYIVSKWHPEHNYQGWVNTMHGGILSTLIDEVCGWVVTRKLQTSGYTVQLNVKFKKAYKFTKDMLEHIADFTAWPILTGILVGYVANRIMIGEGKGCCMNLIMGIIGSYVGTFISHLLNIELLGKGYLTNFVFCVVGAVTVLWIWKKLFY